MSCSLYKCLAVIEMFNFTKYRTSVFFVASLILTLISIVVPDNLDFCEETYLPEEKRALKNCSLACSVNFQHVFTNTKNDEFSLCEKNTSFAILCNGNDHSVCRKNHAGSYCKFVPCFCKTKLGSQESYILDPSLKVPQLQICVVSSKHINPDLLIVPFPWRTLLIVCGFIFALVISLICMRYVTPNRNTRNYKEDGESDHDTEGNVAENNGNVFHAVPQQSEPSLPQSLMYEVPRVNRANNARSTNARSLRRAHYITITSTRWGTRSAAPRLQLNQDRPPPYNTIIQLPPPAYEDISNDDIGQQSEVTNYATPESVQPLVSDETSVIDTTPKLTC